MTKQCSSCGSLQGVSTDFMGHKWEWEPCGCEEVTEDDKQGVALYYNGNLLVGEGIGYRG